MELVGRVGDDRAGDALMIALAHEGIGHLAMLRDPARPTPLHLPDAEPDDEVDPVLVPDGGEPGEVSRPQAVPDPVQAPVLEAADVALGLSYVPEFRVLVLTEDAPPEVLPACVDGAGFSGAQLVVLLRAGLPVPDGLPADTTLLEAPDASDSFAALVGRFAAALDRGQPAADAFAAALEADWTHPKG